MNEVGVKRNDVAFIKTASWKDQPRPVGEAVFSVIERFEKSGINKPMGGRRS